MSNQPDFDWNQAASLLGDNPAEVSEDMVAIVVELIESGSSELKSLRAKNPETDAKPIAAQAHQLRGSLLNFGFSAVGTILLKIEKGQYAPGEFTGLVDQAQQAFEASRKLLAERYPSLRLA
jgi:HPt (histidine-containing phosphotransfer) domain-containing protein